MSERLPKYQEDVLIAINNGHHSFDEIIEETGLDPTQVDVALTKLNEIGFIGKNND